ncbi:lysozyme [Vagococcus xieshaowenii]|uniref:Lysozyme n=1 Tax=Vagococcus xieshaowenii TaxID=2562451 RepID=A0AAJ5EF89_9ENTE|nr:lysozyme [Vagococcus xieshaowenii]QCA29013.1 lysozyme [Vagococcus xieshaowenii]TFZ41012.1 lysozyme [Vagococcus xieshaowenii]
MELSTNGINLIKKWEGLRLQAYQDIIGVWTIGYGHTKGVTEGMTITEKEAITLLKEDIKQHTSYMEKVIIVPLTQHQYDALACFHFNLGAEILKDSDLLTAINHQQWEKAAIEMKRYVYAGNEKSPGLINRREDEAKLFLTPVEAKQEETTKESINGKESSKDIIPSQTTDETISSKPEESTTPSSSSKTNTTSPLTKEDDLTPMDLIKKAYEKFFS